MYKYINIVMYCIRNSTVVDMKSESCIAREQLRVYREVISGVKEQPWSISRYYETRFSIQPNRNKYSYAKLNKNCDYCM